MTAMSLDALSGLARASTTLGDNDRACVFADIALGVGVVAGVLTAVFYVTRPEKPVATMDTGVSFTPAVGPGFAGAALGKRF